LFICQYDNRPGNVKLFGQLSRGRKTLTAAHTALQDRPSEAAVDLPRQRLTISRKWYYEWHGKWTFKNTTIFGTLE
jgi:hypothetical protein